MIFHVPTYWLRLFGGERRVKFYRIWRILADFHTNTELSITQKQIWLTELTKYWCYWIFSIIWLLKTLYSGFNGSHMWVISPEIIRNLVFSNILPFETLKPFETHVGDNAIHMTVTALGIIFGGGQNPTEARRRFDRAKRGRAKWSETSTERSDGANSWGLWGAVSPPTGSRDSAPENFEILVPLDARKLLFQHAFNE